MSFGTTPKAIEIKDEVEPIQEQKKGHGRKMKSNSKPDCNAPFICYPLLSIYSSSMHALFVYHNTYWRCSFCHLPLIDMLQYIV
jgi:hypothetical protein